MNKQPTGAYTGHLVSKSFPGQAGTAAGAGELYLRLGMGDFFIQFSESDVTVEQLRPLLNQVISVKGEIRTGEWDEGPADRTGIESRNGPYLVITEVLP